MGKDFKFYVVKLNGEDYAFFTDYYGALDYINYFKDIRKDMDEDECDSYDIDTVNDVHELTSRLSAL
ncbi:hypothetical protein IKD67_02045 [Candidatus Saccharibacteria bacterium]|nr:hypothetical protein [Candidatus Saccharibacteria bacterium]